MKYLKLFEDHKETSDKLKELEDKYIKDSNDIIYQYKSLIDEMMYDITDDYHTESIINRSSSLGTYLDYTIDFTGDKYEDLLDKLIEVVDRLKEAYDISYHIYLVRLFKLPVDLQEAKKNIKEYIDKETAMNPYTLKKKSASDIKLKLNISF
jgi:putative lipoic acid-binding regulatory protein